MFIFYFLGVGLPCLSIFCQFWLHKEVQCVYLRRHLGSLYRFIIYNKRTPLMRDVDNGKAMHARGSNM